MIENLRKYPGVIIAALAAVFIGFLLMDSQQFFRQSGGNSITVNGVTYDANAFHRLGPSSRALAMQLNSYQTMKIDMLMFASALTDNNSASEDAAEKSFFVNRLLLQQAGRDFGIQPDDEQAKNYLRERSIFVDVSPLDPTSKQFNQETYENFIKNGLGKNGMTENDLFTLVKDFLTYEKLSGLLGGAIAVNPNDVKQDYQVKRQKIGASYVKLKLDDFKAKHQPTEEQLKEHWELRKDKYTTETRRKFTYVIGTPKYPAGAEKAPETPKPAKPGDPAPEPSDADKKIMEQRRLADLKAAGDMDDLFTKIDNSKGGEFESATRELGWEIRETEFFTASTLPEVLIKLNPRKTDKTITQLLFDLKTTSDPISKFTDSFPIGDADWFIARLDAEEPSREKTFEEAKEEVTKQWIEEKALEELKATAEEAKKKLEEAIKGGKSFTDAAKDAGYTAASFDPISKGESPTGHPNAGVIYDAAQHINPGSLTDVIQTDAEALIAIVDKREIVKDPNLEMVLTNSTSQMEDQMRVLAFQSWIAEKNAAAKVSE